MTMKNLSVIRWSCLVAAAVLCGVGAAFAADKPAEKKSDVQFKAELGVKETFDDNVFIQDHKAVLPTFFHPVAPNKESFVTTLSPKVGVDYKPCDAFNLSASYAPDIVFYHAAPSEDYVAHRALLVLGGKIENTAYEISSAPMFVDGSDQNPTFGTPGAPPAIGGIPLRDRREQFMLRESFKLTQTVGPWFFRPVASFYTHDFQTKQRLPNLYRGYINYYDRDDVNGGLDVGFKVCDKTHVVAGYRYGQQNQYRGPWVVDSMVFADSPYDSAYQRALFGVEGSPAPWVKLAILAGPDFRDWDSRLKTQVPKFNQDDVVFWVDANASFMPTREDTIILSHKRFEQPAFTSQSMYEDITYDITYKHKFGDKLTVGAGFRLYIGNWQHPVYRVDWIYTPSCSVTYAFNKHLSAEFTYSHDDAESHVPNKRISPTMPFGLGREFTRNLISLGAKYTF